MAVRDDGWGSADCFMFYWYDVLLVWVGSDILRGSGGALQKGGKFHGQGGIFLIKSKLDDLTDSLLMANSQIWTDLAKV